MELIVLSNGHEATVRVEQLGSGVEVKIGDRKYLVDTVATNGAVRSLIIEGRQFEVAVRSSGKGRYQIGHRGSIEEVEVLDPLSRLLMNAGRLEDARSLCARAVRIDPATPDRVRHLGGDRRRPDARSSLYPVARVRDPVRSG